jgi:FeS assembly SUF system protein|tara:strand:- start:745 stop:1059 length:315 start_codon:yes stop_codon:yes gene_type:complete
MISENKLESNIISVLQKVYDPEIPVSIYELGLIYNIDIKQNNNVDILMTLTTPHCPVAEILPKQIEDAVKKIEEVGRVKVEITWEPTWTQDMMSESARLELGLI